MMTKSVQESHGASLTSIDDLTDLTAVIPVAKMAGKLDFLDEILDKSIKHKVKIIIVHDKHDDETGKELKKIISEKNDPSIKFVEGVFGNPGEARNFGLRLCESEWVSFWDSDDEVNVEEYVIMLKEAKLRRTNLAVGLIGVSSTTNYAISQELKQCTTLALQLANFPAFTRMIYQKSRLEIDPFPDLRFGEDLVFLAKSKIMTSNIYLHNAEVYRYKVGNSYQATSHKPTKLQVSRLLRELLKSYRESTRPNRRFIFALIIKILLSRVASGSILSDFTSKPENFKHIFTLVCKNIYFTISAVFFFVTNRLNVIKVIHNE